MGRKGFEKISQREYARRLGVSNEAVRKAIAAGKISKGWDKVNEKIIWEKANEEWGNIHKQANAESEAAEAEARKRVQSYSPPPAPRGKRQDPEDTEEDALSELNEFALTVASDAPFAEALRVEKVAKARQEVIKLRELQGSLVNKSEVYKQLFGFGQSVRQAALAVPDRCIDEVIAQPTRAEAHQIMTKYLHEALEKLSDPGQLTFKQDQKEE